MKSLCKRQKGKFKKKTMTCNIKGHELDEKQLKTRWRKLMEHTIDVNEKKYRQKVRAGDGDAEKILKDFYYAYGSQATEKLVKSILADPPEEFNWMTLPQSPFGGLLEDDIIWKEYDSYGGAGVMFVDGERIIIDKYYNDYLKFYFEGTHHFEENESILEKETLPGEKEKEKRIMAKRSRQRTRT